MKRKRESEGQVRTPSDTFGTSEGRRGEAERLRILLVDDDVGCLESLRSFLAEEGHWIVTATGGWDAIHVASCLRARGTRLDVSILDFHMPDLTGLETFRRLSLKLPGIPRVFLSGECSASVHESVTKAGARGFVQKPVRLAEVRELLLGIEFGSVGS